MRGSDLKPVHGANHRFGWDRCQNVLWRLEQGELRGLPARPSAVLICIGTNNTSETPNARANTAAEIAEGVLRVCASTRAIVGDACKIILTEIPPREERPDEPRRRLITEANARIREGLHSATAAGVGVALVDELVDLGAAMLGVDGVLSASLAPDFCHPSERGYAVWAEALRPLLPPPLPPPVIASGGSKL